MATDLSAAIQSAYFAWRKNPSNPSAGALKTGTVSELLPGDFIYGVRAVVTVFGALTSGNRTLTLTRLGQTFTVSWPDTQTIYFQR